MSTIVSALVAQGKNITFGNTAAFVGSGFVGSIATILPACWVSVASGFYTGGITAACVKDCSEETQNLALKVAQGAVSALFFVATVATAHYLFFAASSMAVKGLVLGAYTAFTLPFFDAPSLGQFGPGLSFYAPFIGKGERIDVFNPQSDDSASLERAVKEASARANYRNFCRAGEVAEIGLIFFTANPILSLAVSHVAATAAHIAYVRLFGSTSPVPAPVA